MWADVAILCFVYVAFVDHYMDMKSVSGVACRVFLSTTTIQFVDLDMDELNLTISRMQKYCGSSNTYNLEFYT